LNLFDIQSIAFGPFTDTTIAFYQQPSQAGSPELTVGMDTPSMTLAASSIGSISVFASDKVLISSKQCPYCNLAGVNLDGLDLTGADLRSANLMAASMAQCGLTGVDMASAVLSGANLSSSNLSGASMKNAVLNENKSLNLAGAVLSGAYLRNANLAGANLSGTDFTYASFHSTPYNAQGCTQDPNNADFSNNCASAVSATMNNTDFTNAYLAGLDLSGAQGVSVIFTGSVLSGAHLTGSSFDWDSNTGARTSFQGAFLDGVDLTGANIHNSIFLNGYVTSDPDKNCLQFSLSADHGGFPGYQSQYGPEPCVMTATSGATVCQALDDSCTCPNGASGPCDGTAWTSPIISRNQSQQKNGYCSDSPPLCNFNDLYFNW
jgi:uncharacterized protein YjbI with pentapeptide repeats